MAQIRREIRTIRIEDWLGNIYRPEGVGGGAAVGDPQYPDDIKIIDTPLELDPTGNLLTPNNKNITQGVYIPDTDASTGKAIVLDYEINKNKVLASILFEGLPFGYVSVGVRAKLFFMGGGDTRPLFKILTYYIDTTSTEQMMLSATYINKEMFVSGRFSNLAIVTNFAGKFSKTMALKVVIVTEKLPTIPAGAKIYLDNVKCSPSAAGLAENNTYRR